jgi:hypothetical protein
MLTRLARYKGTRSPGAARTKSAARKELTVMKTLRLYRNISAAFLLFS